MKVEIQQKQRNKKIHNETNTSFVIKVLDEWFSHNDKINQDPTVVPRNRSYPRMTKYARKVIVFGDSHIRGINRKLIWSFLPQCRSRLRYFSGARTKDHDY